MIAGIGLVNPKNRINVGAVLRAAHCFGASFVVSSGKRYSKAPSDTMNAVGKLPLFQCKTIEELRGYIPYDCIPVAVDLVDDAQPLHLYTHPKRAFYIFGPEDGTLGEQVLSWCRDKLYIPTDGCLNLAAAVNVVLYDRVAKAGQTGRV